MDIERFCIKFFARSGFEIEETAAFINIFHEWIRLKKLGGILLDVADYRHVPAGPGIMLLTHEINFAMDYGQGRFGLLAQRKRGQGTNHRERLLELVRATVAFGALLESDPRVAGKLKLEGGAFHYLANDRLLAPNTAETFTALWPDLAAVTGILYPRQDISISRVENDPRDRLTVAVESGASVELQALLETAGVVV